MSDGREIADASTQMTLPPDMYDSKTAPELLLAGRFYVWLRGLAATSTERI